MSKIQESASVVGRQQVALQTFRIRLHAPAIAALAKPGQFAMVQVRDGMDPLLRRPLSFHRILPEEGAVELLFRVVGRGTWWLSQATPGARIHLVGPLGNGFELPGESTRSVIVVAGGIGIAPLFELMHRIAPRVEEGGIETVHLFYGARTAAELLPADALACGGWTPTVHWSTDDGSLGFHGFVTQMLGAEMEARQMEACALYACGPLPMQYHVARWASEHRVASQLSLESLMACGIGACLGCALPARHPTDPAADHYVHVCKDGPIFEAGSIQWHKIQMHQAPPPIFLYS